jgi:hypothetical protein
MERVVIFIDGSNFYHGLKAKIGRTDFRVPAVALRKACDKYLPLDKDFLTSCFI